MMKNLKNFTKFFEKQDRLSAPRPSSSLQQQLALSRGSQKNRRDTSHYAAGDLA
jgi:hypothetical protein